MALDFIPGQSPSDFGSFRGWRCGWRGRGRRGYAIPRRGAVGRTAGSVMGFGLRDRKL